MKVVLFCGGRGIRLREVSEAIPKPMVAVGYRPILWHVMRYYAHFGHREFILCLGYRFEYKGRSFVTMYDNEPFRNVFPTDPADPSYDEEAAREGDLAAKEENEKLLRFMEGADLVIHDSQYTAKEYPPKISWGHSSMEWAVESALRGNVKRLALFHHDPTRTDADLDGQLERIRAYAKEKAPGSPLEIHAAYEGLEFRL